MWAQCTRGGEPSSPNHESTSQVCRHYYIVSPIITIAPPVTVVVNTNSTSLLRREESLYFLCVLMYVLQ